MSIDAPRAFGDLARSAAKHSLRMGLCFSKVWMEAAFQAAVCARDPSSAG